MRKIIVAELVQLWWVQALTLGTGVGLFGLIYFSSRQFPTTAETAGVTLNTITTMLICAVPVLYNAVADWDRERVSRLRLIDTLPLSRWRLNLARLLAAALALWPAMLASIPLWILLRSIYGGISFWLGVWVGLVILLLLLIAMRWGWLVVAAYFVIVLSMVPLYFVPVLEPLVRVPLSLVVTPWASVATLPVLVFLGWWIIVSSA